MSQWSALYLLLYVCQNFEAKIQNQKKKKKNGTRDQTTTQKNKD